MKCTLFYCKCESCQELVSMAILSDYIKERYTTLDELQAQALEKAFKKSLKDKPKRDRNGR